MLSYLTLLYRANTATQPNDAAFRPVLGGRTTWHFSCRAVHDILNHSNGSVSCYAVVHLYPGCKRRSECRKIRHLNFPKESRDVSQQTDPGIAKLQQLPFGGTSLQLHEAVWQLIRTSWCRVGAVIILPVPVSNHDIYDAARLQVTFCGQMRRTAYYAYAVEKAWIEL